MKTVALVLALLVATFGAVGVVSPSAFGWLASYSITSDIFYLAAAVRIAFGVALISVASTSRAPRSVRVLGFFILTVGIATALTGLLAIESAPALIMWWLQQGSGVVRATGILPLALGGFILYACAPRRAAILN